VPEVENGLVATPPTAGPPTPAALRVRVLGGLAVDGVDLGRLGSRKARTVLRRLALARGAPVPTDALIELVWPTGAPAEQLSVLASRARALLGPQRLPRTEAGYALLADWLDLDAAASSSPRRDGGSPRAAARRRGPPRPPPSRCSPRSSASPVPGCRSGRVGVARLSARGAVGPGAAPLVAQPPGRETLG
jgi:hypothetical protein